MSRRLSNQPSYMKRRYFSCCECVSGEPCFACSCCFCDVQAHQATWVPYCWLDQSCYDKYCAPYPLYGSPQFPQPFMSECKSRLFTWARLLYWCGACPCIAVGLCIMATREPCRYCICKEGRTLDGHGHILHPGRTMPKSSRTESVASGFEGVHAKQPQDVASYDAAKSSDQSLGLQVQAEFINPNHSMIPGPINRQPPPITSPLSTMSRSSRSGSSFHSQAMSLLPQHNSSLSRSSSMLKARPPPPLPPLARESEGSETHAPPTPLSVAHASHPHQTALSEGLTRPSFPQSQQVSYYADAQVVHRPPLIDKPRLSGYDARPNVHGQRGSTERATSNETRIIGGNAANAPRLQLSHELHSSSVI